MKIDISTLSLLENQENGNSKSSTSSSSSSSSNSSSSTSSSDVSWVKIGPEKQKELEARGWNQKAWDKDDPSLMTFYNEVELDWHQLPEERLKFWTDRGYNKEKWDSEEDKLHDSVYIEGDANTKPTVIKLPLKDLCRFDISYFESLENNEMKVELYNGADLTASDETPAAKMSLKDFLSQLQDGKTAYKFVLEDIDMEKSQFEELGKVITQDIKDGLTNSKLGGNNGIFKEEWQKLDPEEFNWSMWMGAKGTQTPMHFDTDLFNFLYVVEGKKRVVLIPNDHRTAGMFKVKEFYSGSAFTGIDVLSKDFVLPEGSVDVEVGPGEGICISYRWWHSVENMENTLAYGFRIVG
mmetsp:Transcript_2376/g.4316  ORF Transcript_2376/g.4316 Transcript_2376/m.4316 type:complete len:352 (-) Transcript_2376:407-1462(-)|eukprot:CAMPEP_0198288350 /NCGR_PEP_ID=MMETSP1449-20131203/6866_1 /TAXON_ID=420275 /ORGANISM="Attheya septentrionalis, Strain CCMP2084" /LENGTH=351 /DNA_ID=CAMNT_0043986465 /DNA_START=291 /DNA_END=1346 /DNA_ORIENTATION=-